MGLLVLGVVFFLGLDFLKKGVDLNIKEMKQNDLIKKGGNNFSDQK